MRVFKVINNQSGMMAMMGAMIFTIAITTTLSTFYVYTLNQAKYHARIKEAYQLINIMESFATATRKAYDMGMSAHAKSEGCPDGAVPVQIPSTTAPNDKYYCPPSTTSGCPSGAVGVFREDTRELYCSTIQFASNLEIKRQYMYAENTPDNFLKTWRRGLNDYFISPGIKDRVVDTSTMAYVIKKPLLLDWLVDTAEAVDHGQTPNDGGGPAPSPTPVGSSYVKCGPPSEICTVVGAQGSGCTPREMNPAELALYCHNCNTSNQFCPSVGDSVSRNGSIRVIGSDGRAIILPVTQKFSIIM